MLTAPRNGALLVTLAPEIVPRGFIEQLVAADVRVSLGHSMASYRQTGAAMEEGLRGFTHLFNAMRPLASREPGAIAQALESSDAWYGLIVDGVHVDPVMLRLALRGLGNPLARKRCDAASGWQPAEFHSQWGKHYCPEWPLPHARRDACRDCPRHGHRGQKLHSPTGTISAGRPASGISKSGEVYRSWAFARQAPPRVSRRPGCFQSE